METIIVSDAQANLEVICASIAARNPIDPVVARRVQERAEQVRIELRARGPICAAVDLIRESRDE